MHKIYQKLLINFNIELFFHLLLLIDRLKKNWVVDRTSFYDQVHTLLK